MIGMGEAGRVVDTWTKGWMHGWMDEEGKRGNDKEEVMDAWKGRRLEGWISAYNEGTRPGSEVQDTNETQMAGSVAGVQERKAGCLRREGEREGKAKGERKSKKKRYMEKKK